MTLEKVIADLNKGIFASCYLLYGEEEYLINDSLQKILDLIMPQADRDFGLFFLEGENADIDSLSDLILTPSLLSGRKVVVVRNTTIFQSRDNLADLVAKIRANIDEQPAKAAKFFLTFLKIAGFTLEDLQGAGWKKITDEQWHKVVEGDAGDDRGKWLPRIIDICASLGQSAASGADKADKLAEVFAKGLPAGNCIILTADAVDKRKKIFKIVSDAGVVLYFGPTKGEAAQKELLKQQARKLLESNGKNLTPAAWIALGKKTGFELRRSLAELEKLIFFVGDRISVDEKDVEEVVGKTREDSIFDLTAALSEKNQLAALAALKALLDQGLHHLMILTMIVREVRLLLQARILVDSGKLPKFSNNMDYGWFSKSIHPQLTGLTATMTMPKDFLINKHPFVIFNAIRNCGRFSYPLLIGYLEDLLNIDSAMKSSATAPQLLLENFLITACAK
ncbi:MAG: DNA polymerase III subunit delta [Deltaproteobacteria bacterium]